jgi:hypothetical protein
VDCFVCLHCKEPWSKVYHEYIANTPNRVRRCPACYPMYDPVERANWKKLYRCTLCGTLWSNIPIQRGPHLFHCPECKPSDIEHSGWKKYEQKMEIEKIDGVN